MKREAIPVALLVSVVVGGASLVLGVPNMSQAIAFFAGGAPSLSDSESAASMVAWLVIIAASVVAVTGRRSISASELGLHPATFARLMLAAGVVLLAIGSAQHLLPAASVCCGSGSANLREAIQLAH